MNILERLATTQDPEIRKMIEDRQKSASEDSTSEPSAGEFDNRPTWDNWAKQPDPFKKKTIYFRNK